MNQTLTFDDVYDNNTLKDYLYNINELMCMSHSLNIELYFSEKDEKNNLYGMAANNTIIIFMPKLFSNVDTIETLNTYFHELKHIFQDNLGTTLYRNIVLLMEECIVQNDRKYYETRNNDFLQEIEAIEYGYDQTLDIVTKSHLQIDQDIFAKLIIDHLDKILSIHTERAFPLQRLINKFNKTIASDIEDKDYYLQFLTLLYNEDGTPKKMHDIINNPAFVTFFNYNRPLLYAFLSSTSFRHNEEDKDLSDGEKSLRNDAINYAKKRKAQNRALRKHYDEVEFEYIKYLDQAIDDFDEAKTKRYHLKQIKNMRHIKKEGKP